MKSLVLVLGLSFSFLARPAAADPMGINEAICRTPQYYQCFGVSEAECRKMADLPLAYCYKAIGFPHPQSATLKTIAAKLKGGSGVDIGQCGEATYFQMHKEKLVSDEKCKALMKTEQGRWSKELVEFANEVSQVHP